MALTMMQKRTDLASYLQTLLVVHDAQFTTDRVDVTERRAIEQNLDRKSRVAITGDPVRYCIILDTGETRVITGGTDASGNITCRIGHGVDIRLFWQKDYDQQQTNFENCVYNLSTASSPGVLDSIRTTRIRTVSSDQYMIGVPGEDAFASISRGSWDFGSIDQPELAHYLQITTTLVDL